jgi:hypothetical protein
VTNDKQTKHNIFGPLKLGRMNIRNEPTPYMLNILERDFLCEAAEHLVVQRDAR